MKHISLIFVSHVENRSNDEGFGLREIDPQRNIRLNNRWHTRPAYLNLHLPYAVSIKQSKTKIINSPTIRI